MTGADDLVRTVGGVAARRGLLGEGGAAACNKQDNPDRGETRKFHEMAPMVDVVTAPRLTGC